MIIVHLINQGEWESSRGDPLLFSESISQFGFVHCCLPEQMPKVLVKWFTQQDNVIAVEIDSDRLDVPLVFENPEGGEEQFPHIYGLVKQNAIIKWYPVVI
jgi:uncharacterized protein (DUF952 family)